MVLIHLLLFIGLLFPAPHEKGITHPDSLRKQAWESELNGNYSSAIPLYRSARKAFYSAGDTNSALDTYLRIARCEDASKRPEERDLNADSALFLARKLLPPDNPVAAKALKIKAEGFIGRGQLDTAISLLRQAEPVLYRHQEWEEWGWTQVLFSTCGFVGKDYAQMEQALDRLWAAPSEQLDPGGEVFMTALQHTAVLAQLTGDFDKAMENSLRSIDLRENLPVLTSLDSSFLATSYNNVGAILFRKGDLAKALEYEQAALTLHQKRADATPFDRAEIYNNIGSIYHNLGQEVRAGKQFIQALDELKDNATPAATQLRIKLNLNLAHALTQAGNSDSAQLVLTQTLKIQQQNGLPTGHTRRELGRSLLKNREPEAALSELQASLTENQVEMAQTPHELGSNYLLLGEAFQQQGNFEQALNYLQKGLQVLLPGYSSTDVLSVPSLENVSDRVNLLSMLNLRANTLFLSFQADTTRIEYLKAALANTELAASLIDQMRNGYTAEGSKQSLMSEQRPVFEHGIAIALALFRIQPDPDYLSKAFQFAQKSKSVLLLQSIRDAEAKVIMGLPPQVQETSRQLNLDLGFYTRLLNEEKLKGNAEDPVKRAVWEEKVFELSRNRDRFDDWLRIHYPEYFQMRFETEVVRPELLQSEMLAENEVLIEFLEGEQHLYVFALTREGLQVYQNEKPEGYDSALVSLRRSLSDYRFIRSSPEVVFDSYTRLGYQMYELLLKEALEALPVGYDQLILIPDGRMGYLPFEALLTEKPVAAQSDYSSLPYLLRNYQVRYAYSATLLQDLSQREPVPLNGQCIAFAPAVSDENDGTQINEERKKEVDLPGSQLELKAISRYLEGEFLFGGQANERTFKQKAADYSLIHLAMHGQTDDQNPINSRLVFANEDPDEEDNYLYAFEIYNLPLQAEMVVLSACETGYGKMIKGEGIYSLARGFRHAGAGSVLMTLWEVDDRISAELMETFYAHLSKGEDRAAALRTAKLTYLDNADPLYSHPAYWSAYVSIGENGPVKLKGKNGIAWGWLLAGVGLVIVILLGIWWKGKK